MEFGILRSETMRIAITTLGCKINQYDSAVIQNRLEAKHSFVAFDEAADCYVINTCTVTDRADWEARQLVRRAKRRNPGAKVLVTADGAVSLGFTDKAWKQRLGLG